MGKVTHAAVLPPPLQSQPHLIELRNPPPIITTTLHTPHTRATETQKHYALTCASLVQVLECVDKDAEGNVEKRGLMHVRYVPLTRPGETDSDE